jgi:hypothetical protein
MFVNREADTTHGSAPRKRRNMGRVLGAGCAAGAFTLGGLAFSAAPAAASPKTIVLHFYSKAVLNTFYNASDVAIQGYPPVGGHALENDVDYVGTHAHHAKQSTATDHLFCTVISAPANGVCFIDIAIGGSLIYSDNVTSNLAAANTPPIPFQGGTGTYAGYSGQVAITNIGSSNNSDLTITLHKG